MKRWTYVIWGVISMLFAGLIYAWSVLSRPIAEYFDSWSSAQLSFTFTICMAFFCLGGVASGLLTDKLSVRTKLIISAILFLLGFTISARMNSVLFLYIGYGVMAGAAAGLVYNTTISTVSKYFPDKLGLISGILLMGFGMGSFIVGKVYQAITGEGESFRDSLMMFGIILFVVLLITSFLLRAPKPEEMTMYQSEVKAKGDIEETKCEELTTSQMVKRHSFWLYFMWTTLLSAAGLALIAQASVIALEVNDTASSGTLATVVGLISIFGAVGRVLFGEMYDSKGRKLTMWIIITLFFAAVFILAISIVTGNFILLICGYIVIGLAYGGIPSSNSAYVGDFYGKKHYPVNFSIMNMCLLVASFAGTISGGIYDATGSHFSTLIFMGVLALTSVICTSFIKKP